MLGYWLNLLLLCLGAALLGVTFGLCLALLQRVRALEEQRDGNGNGEH